MPINTRQLLARRLSVEVLFPTAKLCSSFRSFDAMTVTMPTIAVDFGGGQPPKQLNLEELYNLMKKDDTGNVEKAKTNAPIGSVSEVKNIYKSSKDKDGNWTWVDTYPKDTPEPAENAVTDTYAVLVRNVKSQNGRKKLEANSIVIQSPWLKKALGDVILKDYPGVVCELKRLTFEAPFKPFVHRWADLVEYMGREDVDETTKSHLEILHGVLKYEIGDQVKAYEDYVLNGVITFEHLW